MREKEWKRKNGRERIKEEKNERERTEEKEIKEEKNFCLNPESDNLSYLEK
jgi:hypothetical protein